MKAITIRGIDSDMSVKLKQIAKSEKKSVNQLVLDLIKQDIGMQKKKDIQESIMIWTTFLGDGRMQNLKRFKVALIIREKLIWNYGHETDID